MSAEGAAGHRFIISSGEGRTLPQIAEITRSALGRSVRKPRYLADWILKAAAVFRPSLRDAASDVGVTKKIDDSASRRVLGLHARGTDETVIDTARSVLSNAS